MPQPLASCLWTTVRTTRWRCEMDRRHSCSTSPRDRRINMESPSSSRRPTEARPRNREAQEPEEFANRPKACQRCGSTDVKFKYLNNKKQPRYECRTCRYGGRGPILVQPLPHETAPLERIPPDPNLRTHRIHGPDQSLPSMQIIYSCEVSGPQQQKPEAAAVSVPKMQTQLLTVQDERTSSQKGHE
uniref:Dof-type domain-containing protein n=1 Tax=Physcomitrium patens TaxID=3218 RepID=A0A2K1J4H2_PHYPA|nr:hypothetical protein PHYPA_022273 [Physcomitrium patens]